MKVLVIGATGRTGRLAEAEQQVLASELDWSIVRPTRLTDTAGTGHWTADPTLVTGSMDRIPRADLVRLLVEILTDASHSRTAVSLTGSG